MKSSNVTVYQHLDSSAAAVLQTKYKKKFSKNFKNQNFENLFQSFLAYWHIDHVCRVLWESEKNCRRSSNL